jgi:hypothetical protein
MTADAKAAVIAFLLADTDVASLAGARVYGDEEAFRAVVAEVVPRTVTIARSGRIAGEGDRGYAPIGRGRFDLKCFGETRYEASKLHEAVSLALKNMVPTTIALGDGSVRLYNATYSGGPMDLVDPDAQWPYVWSSWGVMADERQVGGVFAMEFAEEFA